VRLLAIVFLVGFPVAVALAWIIQRRPDGKWSLDSLRGQGRTVLATVALGVLATAGLAWLILPRIEDPPKVAAYEPLPNSVAILPFADADSAPHERKVAGRLYTALLEGLNQSRDLTQVQLRLTQRPRDVRSLGRRVRVAALLVGQVVQSPGGSRVEMQLLDVGRDRVRWSQSFDWDPTRIMDTGAAIANSVLEAMDLPPLSRQKFAGTDKLDAYEAFLLGGQHRASFNSALLTMAMDDYQRAVDLDPEYVLAHVALAETIDAYLWVAGPPEEKRKALRARAEKAFDAAVALDDQSPSVISLQGDYARGWEVRIRAYERALELDPHHAPSYYRLGNAMWANEKREEAARLIAKALELDPLNAWYHNELGSVLLMLGRDEEAATEYRNSIELEPDLAFNYMNLGAIEHLYFGRLDEAVINYRKAYALDPGGGWSAANLAYTYAYLGAEGEAFAWMQHGLETSPTKPWAWAMAVVVQERFGRREAALESSRRLLELKPNDVFAFYLLGAQDVAEGRAAQATERWESMYPTFGMDDPPKLTFREFEAALMFATNLMEAGEDERARRLLRHCQSYLETAKRRDESYMLVPWIHSLLGHKEETLAALRYAIEERNVRDEGLLFEPWHFDFVREEPEFQRLEQIVRADLARQLERIREMERNGEMPPAPGVVLIDR
jgi:tetratricopeptide (TPR) repeat protein